VLKVVVGRGLKFEKKIKEMLTRNGRSARVERARIVEVVLLIVLPVKTADFWATLHHPFEKEECTQ
jgi:hypothetical protein